MKNSALLSSAVVLAFASGAAAKTADTSKGTPVSATETGTTNEAAGSKRGNRIDSEAFAIRTDIPIPAKTSKRGSTSKFPFDKLEVGQSIGIKGRDAKSLGSTISNQNKKYMEQVKDANGQPVFKMTEIKAQDGTVTGRVPTDQPEMKLGREFVVVDVDPKTDPDGADCRIFRKA